MGEEATPIIFGPDVSGYQHDGGKQIDWAKVDAGCQFGIVKATQGTWYTNRYFAADKKAMDARARETGFVRAAYLFLEQGHGAAQADYFHKVAGDLPYWGIVIDVESIPGRSSYPTLADAKACVTRLRQLYPHHPIGGYIPPWYWDGYWHRPGITFIDWLWCSRYVTGTDTPARLYAKVPARFWDSYGGKTVDVLQHTPNARVAGIVTGPCDASAFRGTADALRKLWLPAPAPPPAPPPPPPDKPDWQDTVMDRIPTLHQGDNRPRYIHRAQALINIEQAAHKRPALHVDGLFGPSTATAVRHVQSDYHLKPTPQEPAGVIGPHTWAVLLTGADL